MNIFEAIVLGIIQGIGEFLPISSSGHLVLTPWLFGWDDPGLSFDVALHFGTLVAVVIYFGKDVVEIIRNAFSSSAGNSPQGNKSFILWIIAAGTIPGALAGYLFEEQAETVFRNPLLIAFTLSFVGLVLYLADRVAKQKKDISQITFFDAVLIGLAQAVAIVPGVSRSGATITAGLLLGLGRKGAAKFSFLLSMPIIFGATVLKAGEFIRSGVGLYEIIGIASAAISGYFAIAGLMKFIERVSYKIFFWYRLALALLIVVLFLFN